jgi:alpha-amylase
VASIHDLVHFKQPDLDKKIVYDDWPRKSLVDHFLRPGLTLDEFLRGGGEIGDFLQGVFETRIRRFTERVEARLSREGLAGAHRVRLSKTIVLDVRQGGKLEFEYALTNLPPGERMHFGVEFNFAGMAAGASDRYYYDADGHQLGQLESVNSLEVSDRVGLVDEWLGVDVTLETSLAGGMWTFPIQTISQSESGFELVHQSSAVVPHWEFEVPAGGSWGVKIALVIDTSAAQARRLREATLEVG